MTTLVAAACAALIQAGMSPATALATAARPTTARPVLTVASPAPYQSFPAGVVQLGGQATSSVGISSVQIQIVDMSAHAVVTSGNALLGAPRGAITPWSFSWQPPAAASYSAQLVAVDKKGTASATAGRAFDVADTAGPSFLTLLFGRSQLGVADHNCQLMPNTVPLNQVAATLKSMNLPGTGSVVTSYIADGANTCVDDAQGNDVYPSWQQLNSLRDTYGMTFVSQGVNYVDVRTLAPQDQEADICGSLPILAAHGHTRAWGLFGYPNNFSTSDIQSRVTANCFSYGRTYANVRNHEGPLAAAPYWANGFSLLGGACNAPKLWCSSLRVIGPVTGRLTHYQSPFDLRTMMAAGAGEWTIVQMYTFVTGSYNVGGTGLQWDCSSPDWHAHFTTDTETYCWNDYLGALASLQPGVTVADPATVAQAFSPDSTPPQPSIDSGPDSLTNQTTATFTFSASELRSWYQCSLDGSPAQLCDSGVSYSGLADGDHNFTLTVSDAYGNTAATNWAWTVNTGMSRRHHHPPSG